MVNSVAATCIKNKTKNLDFFFLVKGRGGYIIFIYAEVLQGFCQEQQRLGPRLGLSLALPLRLLCCHVT